MRQFLCEPYFSVGLSVLLPSLLMLRWLRLFSMYVNLAPIVLAIDLTRVVFLAYEHLFDGRLIKMRIVKPRFARDVHTP